MGKIGSRSGDFLLALKVLYEDIACSVDVHMEWFSGVKQGYILSPVYWWDYVQEINRKHLVVN